jgi:hypothetical protein
MGHDGALGTLWLLAAGLGSFGPLDMAACFLPSCAAINKVCQVPCLLVVYMHEHVDRGAGC